MMSFDEFLRRSSTRLDTNQMEAVRCDTNCVIRAGAGSGKTMVLSYRFLRLVLERKAKANEILTLTFTRKAAREMQQRIYGQLLLCTEDEEIARQLADFGSTSIATLDSFCSSILKRDSMYWGVAEDFTIDDEQSKRQAQLAAKDLLDARVQSEGARLLSILYSPDRLIDEVLLPLAVHHYPMPCGVDTDGVEKILQSVQQLYDVLLAQFIDLLQQFSSLTSTTKSVVSVVTDAQVILARLDDSPSLTEVLQLLSSPMGYQSKPRGKQDDLVFLNENWESYLSLRKRLCIALAVLTDRSALEEVHRFTARYIELIHARKRESGVLTFADVASLAVHTLMRNTTLRDHFKKRFSYIMIDEFQDNNELQKQLLYLLAERRDLLGDGIPSAEELEPNKLFFVGDEKQSIYRFRGADVSVFKALGDELVSIGGREITLETNYRSEPDLIGWYNTLFPSVMANDGERWEAEFSPLGSRSSTDGVSTSVAVMIKPYLPDNEETEEEEAKASDAEAWAVATLIDEMLHTDGYLIPSKDGPIKPQPADIAILLRTTSNQLSFEKALRQNKIPYTVQAARSMMLEALASDIYAMLQLALYPEDRLAYATVLRSPFCKISDRGLADVIMEPPFGDILTIDDEDRTRLESCKAVYQAVREGIGTLTLSALIHLLFYESGYYLHLTSRPSYQLYLEHYTFLHRLAQMQEEAGRSVTQFVDFLRTNLAQNEKIDDLEVIQEEEGGVQIMSIHKSKGLEFPIVIVANTGSVPKRTRSPLSHWQEVVLPHYLDVTIHESAKKTTSVRHAGELEIRDEELAREHAELKRLLYVALTRSKTHLVFSGAFTKNNRNRDAKIGSDTLLTLLTRSMGIDINSPRGESGIVTIHEIPSIPASHLYHSGGESEATYAKRVEGLSKWYTQAAPPIIARSIRTSVTALFPPAIGRDGVVLPILKCDAILDRYGERERTAFGTLVHALIEARLCGEETEPTSHLIDLLSANEWEVVRADAHALTDLFFASDFYRVEIEPYRHASEVGFYRRLEVEGRSIVAQGIIDLVVEQKSSVLIVDFKSDRYRDESQHRRQLITYMEAAHRIYGTAVRGCVLYLREPSQYTIEEFLPEETGSR